MRTPVPLILASLLAAAPALFSQAAATRVQVQSGIQTERQRELNALSTPDQPAGKAQSASVPWRTLSSEQGDDPTLSASAPPHEAPRDARKAAQKAEHLSKKGRHEEAVAEFRRALKIDPEYYEAENNMALELEAIGKADEAEKTFRRLIDTAPAHVLAFTNLANLLFQEHRYDEAEAVARESLKVHRFSFKSSYLLGASLVQQGKWTDEAKAKLQYAQVKYPEAKLLLDKWQKPSAASN